MHRMMNASPSNLYDPARSQRILGLKDIIPEKKGIKSILLDKDERELVKKGD